MTPSLALLLWFISLVALLCFDPAQRAEDFAGFVGACDLDVHHRNTAAFAMARR